jgi:hypothetical protein
LCNKLQLTLALTLCLLGAPAAHAFEDVTTHGATGDGVTDDTSAIQNAIFALPAAGGAVYFPAGTYVVTSLPILSGSSILFYGEGSGASILKQKASTSVSMVRNLTGVAGDIQFRDMGFDGNETNQTSWTTAAMELKCVRFRVESCAFVGTKHAAINLDEVEQTARILNSTFTEMAEHGGAGGQDTTAILINATTIAPADISVIGNFFQADAPSADGKSPGGVMINPGTAHSHRVIVSNNVFKGIGQDFASNFTSCVQLYRNAGESVIQGNKFYDTAYRAIAAQRSSNLLITDNIIKGESTTKAIQAIEVTGRNDSGVIDQHRIIISRNIIHNMPSCAGVFLNFAAGGEGNDIQVIDNIMEDIDSGITLSHVHGGTLVRGNIIQDVSGGGSSDDAIRGIDCEGWVHISGNYINDVTNQQAITFNSGAPQAVEVVVSENSIEAVSANAIVLKDIDRAIVTNNVFRGTPGTIAAGVLRLDNIPYAEVHGNIAPAAATTVIASVTTFQEYGNSWDTSFRQSFSASKTWDPANMVNGATETTTITISGAVVGDPVEASHDQLGANDILISAHVQSANTVLVILMNKTGLAQNLPSGTLQATVFQY